MEKDFDFYANTKKNWNNGEGLPDVCDEFEEATNEKANMILRVSAWKFNMTKDELFNLWERSIIRSDDTDCMESLTSMGLPEGTTMNMALGHPLWQTFVWGLLCG